MAAPEAGFWNMLRGVVDRLFRPPPQAQRPEQQARRQQRREEREERKDNAELIIRELERVTEQHPAHEILSNIRFDARTLRTPEGAELAKTLLNILHSDPSTYHDPEWLKNKLRDLHGFDLGLQNPDQGRLETIQKRVENLLKKAREYQGIRDVEIETEINEAKGALAPAETAAQEIQQRRQRGRTELGVRFAKNKDEAIADLADLPPELKVNEIVTASNNIDNPNDPKRDIRYYWEDLAGKFEQSMSLVVKSMAGDQTTSQAKVDQYNRLKTAYQKSAREFVDLYGKDRSRIYEFAGRTPGGMEYLEKSIHENENYMDYWFYHIISPILYNQRATPHRELFNLYVAADMDMFLEMVRSKKDPDGNPVGLKLANRYIILMNTIFQSHDMDFYAAHPSQEMKEFLGNTSLFLNEYVDAAHQDPMVSLAKRMYEAALLHIRESNNGFIPRAWLAWQEGKLTSKLDEMVQKYLVKAIASGQLYHVKMDPITGLPAPSMWNRKQIDKDKKYTLNDLYSDEPSQSESWKRTVGDLKIAAALKQAKGLALVDMRLLEIIGLSKGTGSDFYDNEMSVTAFNSVPYEGIVRHLEPIIHYFSRYRVGFEYYDAFFNMLITEWKDFDPHWMGKIIELHYEGNRTELEKYVKSLPISNKDALATRLIEMDNPFSFSGMWGTMTKWRVADATADFDDWERDRTYATSVKITNVGDLFSSARNDSFMKRGTFAERKVRQYFEEVRPESSDLYWRLRSEYREALRQSNDVRLRTAAEKDSADGNNPNAFDDIFQEHWRKVGVNQKKYGEAKTYQQILNEEWGKYFNEDPKNHLPTGEAAELIKKVERAYKARIWVQSVMRSPLILARERDTQWEKHGFTKSGKLRKKIIYDLIGIDLDETGATRTVKDWEEAGFDRVSDIESALASMQQIATRDNRDLRAQDFEDAIASIDVNIKDESQREEMKQSYRFAKQYWEKVLQSVLGEGTTAENASQKAQEIYRRLGIEDATTERKQGLRFHNIHWDTIKNININPENRSKEKQYIIPELNGTSLDNDWIDREWRHLFSTEDMGWEYLNIDALGERNPVRRAGDLGSHVGFNQLFEKYLTEMFVSNPKIEDLAKAQKEMWVAMSGDFADIAVEAVGRVMYTTAMMYKKADWAWKYGPVSAVASIFKDASIMQIIRGRDRSEAWGPNELLHYMQTVGGQQILPKKRFAKLGGHEMAPNSEWDLALMSKRVGGTKAKASWEIINTVFYLAILITLWRALSAKSEEEEK